MTNFPPPELTRQTVKAATSFADSPAWITKLAKWGEGFASLIRNVILGEISKGAGPIAIAAKIRQYAEAMPQHAAETLMRTLQIKSYQASARETEKVNGRFITGRIRIATLDERTCLTCVALHGTKLEPDEEVDDHYRGRCELPGNLISGPAPTAFVSRNYDGDAIVIHTASGKKLSVTAQHPILTSRGWVPANVIQVGFDVVGHNLTEGTSASIDPNEYHVPAPVEDIPSTFGMNRFGAMPISSQDFHGDGIDGDIGIVYTNGFLGDTRNSSLSKPTREKFFGCRTFSGFLFSLRNFDLMFFWERSSFAKFVHRISNLFKFLWGHSLETQYFSFGSGTPCDVCLPEPIRNNAPGNSERFRKGKFGLTGRISGSNLVNRKPTPLHEGSRSFTRFNIGTFGFCPEQPLSIENISQSLLGSMPCLSGNTDIITGQITFDRVVDVEVIRFSGHVYSIQTKKGWYISNGIITHNCSIFYQVLGGPEYPEMMQADSTPGNRKFVPFQTGEEWFKSLSPERQRRQASFLSTPAKYKAYLDGHPLSEFVGHYHDETFGDMTVEQSLKGMFGDEAAQYYIKPSGGGGKGELGIANPMDISGTKAGINLISDPMMEMIGMPGTIESDMRLNSEMEKIMLGQKEWISKGLGKDIYKESVIEEFKDDIAKYLADKTDVDYNTANNFIRNWAISSNNDNETSLFIQQRASELFGAPLSEWQKSKINGLVTEKTLEELSFIKKDAVDKLLQEMYNRTQKELSNAGIKEVVLTRGVKRLSELESKELLKLAENAYTNGESIRFSGNALESWSTDIGTAQRFADAEHGGWVFGIKVPANKILSTSRTGFGCPTEYEYVLLGGENDKTSVIYFKKIAE
jgi:hypothetical protein